jgi:DNA excision repair protein ERCC-5
MGVTGLWPILHPCARPIKLETLNRKRLAVDASIWIYQFLKAVRDKEGNALRNSHVVGFFRRICKLLFFGIKPVFVFDGGAPALKRQTVLGRKRRREGRRDDAVRTAGKLLAVQMQRRLEEDEEKRKRERDVRGSEVAPVEEEELPAAENLVYVDEIGMSNQERQQTRRFTKKDAYHLPELNGGIENMGQPDDPRIMSAEELEEYARQFDNGEDINLYDFSKIDFDGEFFVSLPPVDRYNILNAARLRSRLRMGLSKEQLEDMFPDRMAFSRFQIERVRERNELTQRLMNLNGMNDKDAMWGVTGGGRIAGERDREYVLVKNDGVEGGWALGVVTMDKSMGERSKPIDVDAISRNVKPEQDEDWEDEEDFEDVPIEGLNRLPKIKKPTRNPNYEDFQAREIAAKRKQLYASRQKKPQEEESNSLFVPAENGEEISAQSASRSGLENVESDDEERELNRAIALSLQNQHGQSDSDDENIDFEDVSIPAYEQKAVEAPKPLTKSSGRMVAHIVNNRANAAVPKRKAASISSDDSDMDLKAVLASSRKQKSDSQRKARPAPVPSNIKNPFDGPLPFEKLDFKTSIFGKRKAKPHAVADDPEGEGDESLAGGFERDADDEAPKPLPPWMVQSGDIRSDVQEQRARDVELNAEDRAEALEEERIFKRDHGIIEVESSDDDSDVEVVDARPRELKPIDLTHEDSRLSQRGPSEIVVESAGELAEDIRAIPPQSDIPQARLPSPPLHTDPPVEAERESSVEEFIEWSDSDREDTATKWQVEQPVQSIGFETPSHRSKLDSPSLFEAIKSQAPNATKNVEAKNTRGQSKSPSPIFEDVDRPDVTSFPLPQVPEPELPLQDAFDAQEADIVSDVGFDEFSDPEDEDLLAQLAIEAEEHARFASTLNNKSAQENQEAYERELKALRNQQKKDRRDADEVSHIMITECQALLRLFGLPYITAPMEAEAQCAELVRLGLVDGIVTDDSDIFLFGGTRVYKNMFNSNKFVECYLSSDLEKELTLSRHQLISIAHLLGSDYTEGLPGIGPVTALEILSEFSSPNTGLEDFKEWWADVQLHNRAKEADSASSFRKKFRKAQATKLFLPPAFPSPAVTDAYIHPEVDSDPQPFQWGVPDLDALRQFLMATIGWSQERTDEVLVPVIKDMNRRETEGTQSNITHYFEGGVGVGARQGGGTGSRNEGFAPRVREKESVRMREAVKKLKTKAGRGGGTEMGGGMGVERNSTLGGTFAEEAAEWAKKDKREWAKLDEERERKGWKKRKAAGAELEAQGGDDEVVGHPVVADADDAVDDGDESDDLYTNGNGRSNGKDRGGKSNGKLPRSKRKRNKVTALDG